MTVVLLAAILVTLLGWWGVVGPLVLVLVLSGLGLALVVNGALWILNAVLDWQERARGEDR